MPLTGGKKFNLSAVSVARCLMNVVGALEMEDCVKLHG